MNFVKKYIKNFYVIGFLAFLLWIAFFDKNDFYRQYELRNQLNEIKKEKKFYEEKKIVVEKEREELRKNSDLLEKFAREKYLMHKETEDVYIVDIEE